MKRRHRRRSAETRKAGASRRMRTVAPFPGLVTAAGADGVDPNRCAEYKVALRQEHDEDAAHTMLDAADDAGSRGELLPMCCLAACDSLTERAKVSKTQAAPP